MTLKQTRSNQLGGFEEGGFEMGEFACVGYRTLSCLGSQFTSFEQTTINDTATVS